jgi:SpoIIAA-like
MYERVEPSDGPVVGVRIQAQITDQESRQLVDLIRQRAQRYGPVRLLVVYEADPGLMGAENLYDDLRFAKLVSKKIAKLAVVGKYDWESTWIGLFGLFGGLQTAYYDSGRIEAALAWLQV